MLTTTRGWIISSGVVAIALVVPLTVAGAHNLKPLFLINGIVFVLAASAFFTHHDHAHAHAHGHEYPNSLYDHHYSPEHDILHHHYPPANSASFDHHDNSDVREDQNSPAEDPSPPVAPVRPAGLRRTPTPSAPTFDDLPKGKPASWSKEKADETESMEDTWERIKAEKHMTKSSTWHGRGGEPSSSSAPASPYNVKKTTAGMFIERIPTWLRMKKETSMGREDLNARVEAFIKKFQHDMRLQRLESLRRYKSKLLKRGVQR